MADVSRLQYRPSFEYDPERIFLEAEPLPPPIDGDFNPADWLDELDEIAQSLIRTRDRLAKIFTGKSLDLGPEIQPLLEEEGLTSLTYEDYMRFVNDRIKYDTTDRSDEIDELPFLPPEEQEQRRAELFNYNPRRNAILEAANEAAISTNKFDLAGWPANIVQENLSRELTTLQNIVGFINCGKSDFTNSAKRYMKFINAGIKELADAANTNEEAVIDIDLDLSLLSDEEKGTEENTDTTIEANLEDEFAKEFGDEEKKEKKNCDLSVLKELNIADLDILSTITENAKILKELDMKKVMKGLGKLKESFLGEGIIGSGLKKIFQLDLSAEGFEKLAKDAKSSLTKFAGEQAETFVQAFKDIRNAPSGKSSLFNKAKEHNCPAFVQTLSKIGDYGSAASDKMNDLMALQFKMTRADNLMSKEVAKFVRAKSDMLKFIKKIAKVKNTIKNAENIKDNIDVDLKVDLLGVKASYPFVPRSFDSINPFKRPTC
jgi:hypothetical protein